MFGLHRYDLLALAAYLGGITALGIWASRRVKSTSEFIMPRRFGKLMMMLHGLGTATHSEQAVIVAAKSYSTGLAGIWFSWTWLFGTPFYWLIAPMMRRFRAETTGDVFELRYDRGVSQLYAVMGLGKFMLNIGVMLKGSAVIIAAVTDGRLPTDATMVVITVLFVIYGLAGGLTAAIVTDSIQSVLTVVFSFLLLPLILNAVGGLEGMQLKLAEMSPDRNLLSLVAPGDIGVFFIAVVSFNLLLSVAVQPQNMGSCAAGKTEIEGAVGFMGGTLIKRLCTVAWSVTGLAAVAYYGLTLKDPEMIYGQVAKDFLPQLMPGMLGLFIAALLASVMGSCDSFMVASSGLFTNNLYKPWKPGLPDGHYLAVSRFAGLIAVAGGLYFAHASEGVIKLLLNLWKMNAMIAMAFWLGVFWRRATVAGAWAATLAAVLVWWITSESWFTGMLAQSSTLVDWRVVKPAGAAWVMYTPWQMLAYIIAGFVAGIAVSLVTRPVADEKLARFYGLLRTKVRPNEELPASCTLPAGVEPGPRNVYFPDSNWEIPKLSRTALVGFLIGWACVLTIIAVVYFWIAG